MTDEISLEFNNWSDWEGPKLNQNKGKYHWFKFPNDFFENYKFFELSSDEIKCLIFLVSVACKQENGGKCTINFKFAKKVANISEQILLKTIEKLQLTSVLKSFEGGRDSGRNSPELPPILGTEMGGLPGKNYPTLTRRGEERRRDKGKENNITSSSADAALCELFNIWNEECGQLPKARGISEKRKKKIKALLQEFPDKGKEYWTEVVKRISSSSFCTGHGSNGWVADFDWFIQSDTHLRVLEGKFDDRTHPKEKKMSLKEFIDFYGEHHAHEYEAYANS